LIGQPIKTLVEAIATGGTGGLDVPVAVTQRVQTQLVCDLGSVHGIWQVLSRERERENKMTFMAAILHSASYARTLPVTVDGQNEYRKADNLI